MRSLFLALLACSGLASETLLKTHCADCHNPEKAKGKFKLEDLGDGPTEANLDRWLDALDLVRAEEMPPEDDSKLTSAEHKKLSAWITQKTRSFDTGTVRSSQPRRLNNREFANSLRDVLLLEHLGTNQPTHNLLGDGLHHGFDTHGDSLGFSRFHLEQYIDAVRKVLDATILTGEQPKPMRYEIPAERIYRQPRGQNVNRPVRRGVNGYFDFRDPADTVRLADFLAAPATGSYRIRIRCTGKDRRRYATEDTGFYHGDPIQLRIQLGDQAHTFDLADEVENEILCEEWIAAGTPILLRFPTDAFTLVGNGNFKFQNRIVPEYLMAHEPDRYQAAVAKLETKRRHRELHSWHNWTEHWEGARPRLYSAVVEGPFYESWPPVRQKALLGENPSIGQAAEILAPIAERAWRRKLRKGELDKIVALVESRAYLGPVEALKEGIVTILVSPAFLLLHTEDIGPKERFAAKLSYFLQSTTPSAALLDNVQAGELTTQTAIRDQLRAQIEGGEIDEFFRAFPRAWLELNDINFMAPRPRPLSLLSSQASERRHGRGSSRFLPPHR